MEKDRRTRDFASFDQRLRKAKGVHGEPPGTEGDHGDDGPSESKVGLQVGIELFAGVLGGVLFGYMLDSWLETRPMMIVICVILGVAGGVLNAYKHLKRLSEQAERT